VVRGGLLAELEREVPWGSLGLQARAWGCRLLGANQEVAFILELILQAPLGFAEGQAADDWEQRPHRRRV
jgi:hypothetical protein